MKQLMYWNECMVGGKEFQALIILGKYDWSDIELV
jgi:hypothetical protein